MAQTNINIRMDEDLKRQFDDFCSDIGMSMTTAFCVFAKTAVRERKIPFEIKADIPNADTVLAIKEVETLKKNPNKRVYSSFSEVLEELESDE